MSHNYRFDGHSFFLTYSQCELTVADVWEKLRTIKPVLWARIARESHADGGLHIHACGHWAGRVTSRNPRFLDIAGVHPNIQPMRSVARALEYVAKDGEFTDHGVVPAEDEHGTDWVALAETVTRADFMRAAFAARMAQNWAREFWELGNAENNDVAEQNFDDAMLQREDPSLWLQEPSTVLSTVVIGPTGVGKSSWALRVAPKPALWVRHLDVLRCFRKGFHRSIIFDDMAFDHMPRQTQIYVVDQNQDAQIHCRYGYARVPAHTIKIFTANSWPFVEDPAIRRRVHLVLVGENPYALH